jgi:hypothetical protein
VASQIATGARQPRRPLRANELPQMAERAKQQTPHSNQPPSSTHRPPSANLHASKTAASHPSQAKPAVLNTRFHAARPISCQESRQRQPSAPPSSAPPHAANSFATTRNLREIRHHYHPTDPRHR